MACPAQRLQIDVVVGSAVRRGRDVINSGCRYRLALLHVVLTEMLIALENAGAYCVPFAAVTALVSTLTSLVLSPSFVAVVITVT